jgi:hypothetical protein
MLASHHGEDMPQGVRQFRPDTLLCGHVCQSLPVRRPGAALRLAHR